MTKITIRDVAEKLNIGKTTVALALADKYGVSEETKAKIVVAAHEMGYDFSKFQKRKAKSRSIKVVLRDKSFLQTEFWVDIIKGIEMQASECGCYIEIFAFDKSSPISDLYMEVIKGTSVGLLFIDSIFNEDYDTILSAGLPVVLVDPRDYVDIKMTQIKADNYLGGYMACRHLWKKGHRRLAFLGNIKHGSSLRMRWLGFQDYFNIKNIDGAAQLIALTSADRHNANYMHNEKSLIEAFSTQDRPTGLFCGNDMVALRAMETLKKNFNFIAPRDYSIIGFDNIDASSTSDPPLTTLNVDRELMGRTAVKLLMEEVAGKTTQKQHIKLYSALIERQSTGSVKK